MNNNNNGKRKPFTMATRHEDRELEPFSMGSFAEIICSMFIIGSALLIFVAIMDGRIF
tara:strand:+ start:312 stop:485 length:174 start_codon:yes stop_codon:yes gene_type:complete